MFENTDSILRHLEQQASDKGTPSDEIPAMMPVASQELVDGAEEKLGFGLPPTLKRIYLEVGNGGYHLGPGYGLIGLLGGYDNHGDGDLVTVAQTFGQSSDGHSLDWWDQMIVICDWGCNMMSCVDCSDEDFMVFRWDGNAFDEETDLEDPSDELWSPEADTFDQWLLTPNAN